MLDINKKMVSIHISSRCNFRCEYCTISDKDLATIEDFDIDSIMKNITEPTYITFTGGEPFLVPNFIEVLDKLSKAGHWILVLSNLTPSRIKEVIHLEKRELINISCSIHYRELIRTNNLNKFISNYTFLKSNGFNTVWPKFLADTKLTIEEITTIQQTLKNNNIEYVYTQPLLTKHCQPYPETYTDEQFRLLWTDEKEYNNAVNFTLKNANIHQKGLPCKAGKMISILHKNKFWPCEPIYNENLVEYSLGDTVNGFVFNKDEIICPVEHCTCNIKQYWGPDNE